MVVFTLALGERVRGLVGVILALRELLDMSRDDCLCSCEGGSTLEAEYLLATRDPVRSANCD